MHMPLEDTLGLNLLAANNHQAEHNNKHFQIWDLLCLNLMSSPGAGKTALLEQSLPALARELSMAVLEGDMTTCLLYTSPSPRDLSTSRMPSSA